MLENFSDGVEVVRGRVPAEMVDAALRLVHLDLLSNGASAERLSGWLWGAHWFPHLNWAPEITRLADALPAEWRTGQFCDPQILLQFPHSGPEPDITFHVDEEPGWAEGRRYLRTVGIPLSPWRRENGALLIDTGGAPAAVELDPGDAVMMRANVPHSGGVNHTGAIRYAVYFRYLEPEAGPDG